MIVGFLIVNLARSYLDIPKLYNLAFLSYLHPGVSRSQQYDFLIPYCRFGLELLDNSEIIKTEFYNHFLYRGDSRVGHEVSAP